MFSPWWVNVLRCGTTVHSRSTSWGGYGGGTQRDALKWGGPLPQVLVTLLSQSPNTKWRLSDGHLSTRCARVDLWMRIRSIRRTYGRRAAASPTTDADGPFAAAAIVFRPAQKANMVEASRSLILALRSSLLWLTSWPCWLIDFWLIIMRSCEAVLRTAAA